MKTHTLWLAGLLLLGVSGCWREVGAHYLDSDYNNEGLTTIAVLPVINKSEEPLATPAVLGSLDRQLTNEKHFRVLPTAAVMARLRAGGGGGLYAHLLQLRDMGNEPADADFAQLARALQVDAVFEETIVAFHHLQEDGEGASAAGDMRYSPQTSMVVEVKGVIWGARAERILWRDEAQQRYFPDANEGGGALAAVDMATHELLDKLPVNTWHAYTPATPTPVPSMPAVIQFPTPSDPGQP